MNNSDRCKWLEKVYSAKNDEELAEGYDAWARDYDKDVLSFGYRIPAIVCGLTGRYVRSKSDPILDAGVGTGILGEALSKIGYTNLFGIDLSQGMLEIAREKGAYSDLRQMVLGEPLDIADSTFAAVLSVGVFTAGHAPPKSLDELVRVTRPGGYIIFSVRVDTQTIESFKEKQDALESEGKWRLIEETGAFQSLPLGESEVMTQVFVYMVC